jgi:hypothetical protein
MFSIKFLGSGIFSMIFPQSFLPVLENFPGSPKFDAKHGAINLLFKEKLPKNIISSV